ncbi:conserved Plasmodium protein, unknown function [Plasmodium gallinaceum]|uniref:Uncharacterized protein n=1 Tax=Plasmodium gallinaceum TaxID=5849 RepID=A0A1J1GWN0_PLAGA|nr:conserved Plasmodium protein, unknown function [Plasmodium gallinaceum]CRG95421.1 conserved Plasmodium protein, unknown function [Plasmodium gallinaceum]
MLIKNKEKESKSIKSNEENKQKKKKEKMKSTINIMDNKLAAKKRINPVYKNNKNETFSDNKKHYLNDIDKTLLKEDISCISYAYKNLNEQKFSKKKIKNISENNKLLEVLSLENKNKKSDNNYNLDKNIHSLIYDTFINKNLKINPQNFFEKSDIKEKKKKKATLNFKKPNILNSLGVSSNFNNYKKKLANDSKKNLIANKIEKTYVDNFAEINETNEQENLIQNFDDISLEKKTKKDNKNAFTQTNFYYDEEELRFISNFFAKKIINEAFIQITYEQNLNQIEEKSKFINSNDQANKQIFTHLTDCQHNNLNIMKEKNKITNFLQIFNKINVFSISRNIINCLMNENIVSIKEKNELKKAEELEWFNKVTKHLLKNTVAFLATEKIVSFLTEELIEDSLLNFCLFNEDDIYKINEKLNNKKITSHKKKKIEKGYINFLLLNEKIKIYIPIKVKEDMNLDDIIKKIKNFINNKLGFLRKEYNLNFIFIKNKENYVMDIKELYSCESEEFTIYIKKKKKKVTT